MVSKEKNLAFKVSVIYAILAASWIVISNQLVAWFVTDPKLKLIYSDTKGLAFVIVTSLLLYLALRRLLKKWSAEMDDRHQSERERFEAEKLYRHLFEAEADAVFLVDFATGQILDANPAAETLYGYGRQEFLRLTVADISAETERTAGTISSRTKFVPDQMHRRRNGTLIVVEISLRYFEFRGRTVYVATMRDISTRKQAEAAWCSSEERYRSLFQHMNEGVAHCKMILQDNQPVDFVYLSVNEKFSTLTGLKDVLGCRASEVIPGLRKKDPEIFDLFCRVAVSGRPEKAERFVASLQMWFHFSVHQPAPLCFVAVFDDITERKKMEAALRDERDFSAGIINKAPSIICGVKPDGTTTFINPAGEQITGSRAGQIIGKNWWRTFYPGDDYAQVERLFNHFESGEVHDYEMTLTTRGGDRRTIGWNFITRRDAAGHIYEMVGFGSDITDRKRQQRQLQLQFSALTAAANAIVITDPRGNIEWINPSFAKLTGYSEAEAVGQNIRILSSGKQTAEFYGEMWAVIVKGGVWHGELTNRRKDGSFYNEDMTITPVQGENGNLTHFVAIKQDITERRQMDARLRQAEKLEAIGTLAGGIAHDFNNVLAAMFGYAYLLQQEVTGNSAASECITAILQASNRAKDLVQQILTFSRQRENQRQPLRLEPVVREALKFLRASLPAGIKIEMDLDADASLVLADPTQIYQVILNLATNSAHAMDGEKGCLTVKLDNFEPEGDFLRTHPEFRLSSYVRLLVADTGHGMDAAILRRIFEPFFTTKPIGKGTGLGLAVVHGIVQSHEGCITVESQPGRGTTFQIYFPAQPEQSLPPATTLENIPRGDGQTVLILDDEAALGRMLQQLLRRLNYQTVIFSDPHEAIGKFGAGPAQFDVVLTDLTMPDLNGIEVSRQMHAIRSDVPVILTSGTDLDLGDKHLREAGICEVIEKPISTHLLAQALKRVLNGVGTVAPAPTFGGKILDPVK